MRIQCERRRGGPRASDRLPAAPASSTTLAYAMKDRGAKRGLATLCLGGGNAVSMIIERP